jgi:hypothetical protein
MAEENKEPTPEFKSWYEQFTNEHGYPPEDDPDLLGKGLTPAEAIKEHWTAKEWGQDFAAMTGRAPTYDDYRHGQPRRYSKGGDLISGFGGSPPEEWENKGGGGGGSSAPAKPKPNLASGFAANFISSVPKWNRNRNRNNGF